MGKWRTLEHRYAAVTLALVAMLLRGLVPMGWMPNADATPHATLMPCPGMDGMHGVTIPHPAKHDRGKSHQETCPFAATAYFATPQAVATTLPLQIAESGPRQARPAADHSQAVRNWDHAARAPPLV